MINLITDNFRLSSMKKLIFLFFLLTACSSPETDNGVYTKSTTITNNIKSVLKKPWSESQTEGSDYALTNKKSKSFFLINSACRKFEASNLNSLTAAILSGINDLTYIENNKITFEDRDAMMVTAKGSIDGVTRFFKILTVQKNNCIYDIALISTTQKNLETDSNDYNLFLKNIKLN
jgi:hypothetical protein